MTTDRWPSHACDELWVWTQRHLRSCCGACALHGSYALGLSEKAAMGTRHKALHVEASKDLQRYANQVSGAGHADP